MKSIEADVKESLKIQGGPTTAPPEVQARFDDAKDRATKVAKDLHEEKVQAIFEQERCI